MDDIHYHVHSEGRIVKSTVYIALGLDMNGKKNAFGMYVEENERAKFWLSPEWVKEAAAMKIS